MPLPLFDPIDLPPDAALVDINSLASPEREQHQAHALELWLEETGENPLDFGARDWDDNEGIFVVVENEVITGVAIITDVEGL